MALTEADIFDRLFTSYGEAAAACDDLAKSPRIGAAYRRLKIHLDLVEGACRQAAHFREDSRWLIKGLQAAEAAKRASEWLRRGKTGGGLYVSLTLGERHPLFNALATSLRKMQGEAVRTKNAKTGKVGKILPTAQKIFRQNRAVAVSNSGLILPPNYVGAA